MASPNWIGPSHVHWVGTHNCLKDSTILQKPGHCPLMAKELASLGMPHIRTGGRARGLATLAGIQSRIQAGSKVLILGSVDQLINGHMSRLITHAATINNRMPEVKREERQVAQVIGDHPTLHTTVKCLKLPEPGTPELLNRDQQSRPELRRPRLRNRPDKQQLLHRPRLSNRPDKHELRQQQLLHRPRLRNRPDKHELRQQLLHRPRLRNRPDKQQLLHRPRLRNRPEKQQLLLLPNKPGLMTLLLCWPTLQLN